ncbi:MAG: MFS transporter, partial [Paracoccaceae bacterium]
IYRLLAWGMMPIGLLVSGAIVSLSEPTFARDIALTLPFVVAAAGAGVLTLCAWRPLAKGFAAAIA